MDQEPLPPEGQTDNGSREYYATDGNIECYQALRACLGREGYLAWLRGTIIKYNWRLTKKGCALEDAIKIGWYSRELERVLADHTA